MVTSRARRPRLARLIETSRKKQDLWQSELAARLGVSERTVTKWEKGEVVPRPEHLERIAGALGLDLRELQRLRFREKEARKRAREDGGT